MPLFENIVNQELLISKNIIVLCSILLIFIGFIVGIYPLFISSKFNFTNTIKKTTSRYSTRFISIVVLIQLFIFSSLLSATIFIQKQMNYINNKDVGFNKDKIIILDINPSLFGGEGLDIVNKFKVEAQKNPHISNVSTTNASFDILGVEYGFDYSGKNYNAFGYKVDAEFLPTLEINLIKGRNFSDEISSDDKALIINEIMAKELGISNPVNQTIKIFDEPRLIIGLMKNFNFQSFENPINPMFLEKSSGKEARHLLVKIRDNNFSKILPALDIIWHKVAPGKPFLYTLLSEGLQSFYLEHRKWKDIMKYTSLFVLFISSLGVFGLARIIISNRVKEVSIRKVIGANSLQIFFFLSKESILIALIAWGLSIPVTYYGVSLWLSKFEYRIDFNLFYLLLSGALLLSVVLLTISYHTVKASMVNPSIVLNQN